MTDWKEELRELDFINRINIDDWTQLDNFIRQLLDQQRSELIEEIQSYYRGVARISTHVYTENIFKYLDSLKKEEY